MLICGMNIGGNPLEERGGLDFCSFVIKVIIIKVKPVFVDGLKTQLQIVEVVVILSADQPVPNHDYDVICQK